MLFCIRRSIIRSGYVILYSLQKGKFFFFSTSLSQNLVWSVFALVIQIAM